MFGERHYYYSAGPVVVFLFVSTYLSFPLYIYMSVCVYVYYYNIFS